MKNFLAALPKWRNRLFFGGQAITIIAVAIKISILPWLKNVSWWLVTLPSWWLLALVFAAVFIFTFYTTFVVVLKAIATDLYTTRAKKMYPGHDWDNVKKPYDP